MTRHRWIYVNGVAIPAEEYETPPVPLHHVMPDIQPYRSMADGKMVEGRRQHREMLKVNNCIEIGNEKQTPKPRTPPPGLKETLARVAMEKLRY